MAGPLDALLAGRPMWGSLGGLLAGGVGPWSGNGGYSTATSEGGDPIRGQGMVYSGDPGYQDALASLTRNGVTYSQLRSTQIGGNQNAIDPSKVTYDPKLGLITPTSNIRTDPNSFMENWAPFLMAAIPVAGILAGAAGSGTGAGYAEGWSGAAGSGLDPTIAATSGGGLGAGSAVEGMPEGWSGSGVDPTLTGAQGGAPVSEIQAGSGLAGTNQGLLSGLSSQGGVTGLLGQAGQWAMDNPLRAAGLAQMAYGLLASHGNSGAPGGGSSGSSGSAKGGAGQGLTQGNGMQQQFYVNPYTLAQLQRSRGGQ